MRWFGWHGFWVFPFMVLAFIVVCRLFMGRMGCMRTGITDHPGGNSAREVLDQRFARGEITREQYRDMRHEIEN